MRKIRLGNLKVGMTIAQNLYSGSGSIILSASTVVQQAHIDRLRRLGVSEVVIDDARVSDLELHESISEHTKIRAIGVLKQVFESVARAARVEDIDIQYDKVRSVVQDIESDLASSDSDIVTLVDSYIPDDYLAVHSLNVAILSMMVAKRSGIGSKTMEIGVGALLHDVAIPLIPNEITHKRSALDASEIEIIRRHPALGLKIMRQIKQSSPYARAIVYQHHERHDGSGYPRGLRGDEIDPLARIVAVADTYSAMVEPRPHRDRWPRQEAFEYLMSAAGYEFDHQTVQACLRHVAPYPVGTMVKLNTGETGVVIRVSKGLGTRPVVRVFTDKDGTNLAKTYDLDLATAENQTKLIAEVCDD
jgi:HD-GYP domain-containing protein (c-di-GMP phosphodiesterase class II)